MNISLLGGVFPLFVSGGDKILFVLNQYEYCRVIGSFDLQSHENYVNYKFALIAMYFTDAYDR